jgi:hypothetical protein
MRTLIVSDLHLGLPSRRTVLRSPGAREALVARMAGADRVVLLGDLVELVESPADRALEAARPFLESLAGALGGGAEVVVVPGNHDRPLVTPWLGQRTAPLALEQDVPPESSPSLAAIVEALAPTAVRVAYPGVWLRDDVYATHGHYLDAHLEPPAALRLVWPRWRDWLSHPPCGATPSDYEQALARAYDGIARRAPDRHRAGAGWPERLARALRFGGAAVAGSGEARVNLSLMYAKVRTGGLRAMASVVGHLGIASDHVVFGHVHRAGPLASDDAQRWRTRSGARLHNPGGWLSTALVRDPASPYAAGRCVELRDGAPPELVRVLGG